LRMDASSCLPYGTPAATQCATFTTSPTCIASPGCVWSDEVGCQPSEGQGNLVALGGGISEYWFGRACSQSCCFVEDIDSDIGGGADASDNAQCVLQHFGRVPQVGKRWCPLGWQSAVLYAWNLLVPPFLASEDVYQQYDGVEFVWGNLGETTTINTGNPNDGNAVLNSNCAALPFFTQGSGWAYRTNTPCTNGLGLPRGLDYLNGGASGTFAWAVAPERTADAVIWLNLLNPLSMAWNQACTSPTNQWGVFTNMCSSHGVSTPSLFVDDVAVGGTLPSAIATDAQRQTVSTCGCGSEWSGPDCATLARDACQVGEGDVQCSGHGTCTGNVSPGGGKGVCFCDNGFGAPNCSQVLCPMDHGKICGGNGTCLQGACVCVAGFTGPTCTTTAPPAPDPSSLDPNAGAWSDGATSTSTDAQGAQVSNDTHDGLSTVQWAAIAAGVVLLLVIVLGVVLTRKPKSSAPGNTPAAYKNRPGQGDAPLRPPPTTSTAPPSARRM
jgi:hypothetical protein